MESYYKPEDLLKFSSIGEDAPDLWKKFNEWYGEVFKEGALTEREKALIALAVATAEQCPYCIDAFTKTCLEKGSNMEQMTEAVHVASAIKGGATLIHGVQMRNAAKKVEL
jgi:alkylhydroperoxidase/carboxymuconolactone decarboxylase family protein